MYLFVNAIPRLGMAFPHFWSDVHVHLKSIRNYTGTGKVVVKWTDLSSPAAYRLARRDKYARPGHASKQTQRRVAQGHSCRPVSKAASASQRRLLQGSYT